MSSNGSADRLLKRLLLLPFTLHNSKPSSTLCHSCSRLQQRLYNNTSHRRLGGATTALTTLAIRRLSSLSSPVSPLGYRGSLLLSRSYSSSIDLPGPLQTSTTTDSANTSRSSPPTTVSSAIDEKDPMEQLQQPQPQGKQRDATTSIAMIHYAKQGNPDQCLHHYLHLLQSQGTLPSHEALHQLARVLYIKRRVTGFTILHDTLLAYYTLHPLSNRQKRNLTYIYTMFINLIIKVPKPHHTILAKKTTTVIQLCQEMDRLGIPGTPPLYNSLLQFCVTKKDTGLAWSLYDELVARCTPTKYTYSILLDLARQQQDNGRVLQIVDSMAQGGVVPDRAMVSTVMLILCDQRQYNAAADFLDQLAYHAPHIMGPQYHAVLVDTLRQHSRQQYNSLAAKQLRQYKRKFRRKYKRQQVGRLRTASSS